ncbi:hypothetical protein BJ742DRAFT_823024 [Cladochytrium replicatum]|nr:hypothetical protein BJ742DRAFT_823024 [Cladochytrium replicatum]
MSQFTTTPKKLRVCKYGKHCYRTNPAHLAEFSHEVVDECSPPPATTAANDAQMNKKRKSEQIADVAVQTTKVFAIGVLGIEENGIDPDLSIRCGLRATQSFLSKFPTITGLNVWFVDEKAEFVSKIRQELQNTPSCDARIRTFVGSLSTLKASQGVETFVALVECTWRLKPSSHRKTNDLYALTPNDLASHLQSLHPKGQTGQAYEIEVPSESELAATSGVSHIVHVVPPNRNPDRIDYVEDDNLARKLLEQSYQNSFAAFGRCTGLTTKLADLTPTVAQPNSSTVKSNDNGHVGPFNQFDGSKKQRVNAFSILMDAAKSAGSSSTTPAASQTTTGPKALTAHRWMDALIPYIADPAKHSPPVISFDATIVLLADAFPKSRHHYLVLPRKNLPTLASLTRDDIPLLKELRTCAKDYADAIGLDAYRMGFHAVMSMRQVHLHLLSEDFCGSGLKNKKHWNSFHTKFFKSVDEIVEMLEQDGKVKLDKGYHEEFLKKPLRCHICRREFSTMPALKQDLQGHDQSDRR